MSVLALLPHRMAVAQLSADAAIPEWASGPFVSITRTAAELSIVCTEKAVPDGIRCERGWRIFEVAGPLDFSLTGVLSAVAAPLADAGVSIFAMATFDTDYVMVKDVDLERAVDALRAAGHIVQE